MMASALLRHGPVRLTETRNGLEAWLAEREYASVDTGPGQHELSRPFPIHLPSNGRVTCRHSGRTYPHGDQRGLPSTNGSGHDYSSPEAP